MIAGGHTEGRGTFAFGEKIVNLPSDGSKMSIRESTTGDFAAIVRASRGKFPWLPDRTLSFQEAKVRSRFGKHSMWPLIVGLAGLTSNGSVLGRLLNTMRWRNVDSR
jgi:hypothetical protein